jgi:hypothetical protein
MVNNVRAAARGSKSTVDNNEGQEEEEEIIETGV